MGLPTEVADHYREADPMKLAIRASQCIIHGVADDIVPPSLSKDYVSAKLKAKEDARLMMIPDAGHFEIVDPRSAAWATVERAVVDFARTKTV